MKTFITNDEFNQVLELFGLPGETLEFHVGPRNEQMVGYRSSWRLRATIGDQNMRTENHRPLEPYAVRVVYVPVLLPSDPTPVQLGPDEATAETGGWCALNPDDVALVELSERCAPVPCPPFEETKLEVHKCPTCGSPQLKWHPGDEIICIDEFHNYGF